VKLPDAYGESLELAEQVLSDAVALDQRQRDMWLVTAYLLSPGRYEKEAESRARQNSGLVFDLRDRCGFAMRAELQESALSLPVMEFMPARAASTTT
jgi:hypothetical protein